MTIARKKSHTSEEFNRALGGRLKLVRKKLKLSQEDIARIHGRGRGTISEWENGKYPPDIPFLLTFTRKHDVNLIWLLEGEGEQGNPAYYSDVVKGMSMKIRDELQDYVVSPKIGEIVEILKKNDDLTETIWYMV